MSNFMNDVPNSLTNLNTDRRDLYFFLCLTLQCYAHRLLGAHPYTASVEDKENKFFPRGDTLNLLYIHLNCYISVTSGHNTQNVLVGL
jgi:hypothetical protein